MYNTVLDVIIVGAGHAGLSASYFLKKHGLDHIVFERGNIGESWRSQRWDSFMMNTADKLNVLPGSHYRGNAPEGFSPAADFVAGLEAYKAAFQLPVIENATVLSIEKPDEAGLFKVTVSVNGAVNTCRCRQVIVASGEMNGVKAPPFAGSISPHIMQLHTGEYRRPSQLPDGAVLVVGSAQSGCQITEDLIDGGRKVYLSTSMVPRVPGHYRGKDIMDWLVAMNFFNVPTAAVTDPATFRMRAPLLTGAGGLRRTISLQALARKGAVMLGKMKGAGPGTAFFQPDAAVNIRFGDDFSAKAKEMIDAFIVKNGIEAPAPDTDENDIPDAHLSAASSLSLLNLEECGIRSIIWATGFGADFSYLKTPVLDKEGIPLHQNGISTVAGLYFLGLHWLRSKKSGIIFGISDDAEFISRQAYDFQKNNSYHVS